MKNWCGSMKDRRALREAMANTNIHSECQNSVSLRKVIPCFTVMQYLQEIAPLRDRILMRLYRTNARNGKVTRALGKTGIRSFLADTA